MSRDHFREQLLKELDLLQSRVERQESINAALRRLSVGPNLESLGEVFEECIRGIVPFDVSSVSLLRGEQQWEHLKTDEVVTALAPQEKRVPPLTRWSRTVSRFCVRMMLSRHSKKDAIRLPCSTWGSLEHLEISWLGR